MLFSVHTLEAKKEITREEYWELREFYVDDARIYKYSAYTDKDNGDFIINKFTESNGITIKLRRNEKGHSILLVINPRNISGDREYIEIYDFNKMDVFDFLLELYNFTFRAYLGKLDDYIIRRLDLCTNLEFKSQELVDEYMMLIARSRAPYPLHKDFYIENRKRDHHGVYFNGKDYSVYVYDKGYQIRKDMPGKVPESELHRNIIRFEIRLGRNVIYRLEKEYGFRHSCLTFSTVKFLSLEYFQNIIPRLFQNGAYYHLDMVLDLIDKTNLYLKTKGDMKLILYETCKRQDLGISLNYLSDINGWDINKTKYLLKQFDDIGVNPMCIPQRGIFTMLPSIPYMMGLNEKNKSSV